MAQWAAIAGAQVSMVVLRTTPQGDPAMTKANATTGARLLVGIDISKNRHEVLIAVPGKARPLASRSPLRNGFARVPPRDSGKRAVYHGVCQA